MGYRLAFYREASAARTICVICRDKLMEDNWTSVENVNENKLNCCRGHEKKLIELKCAGQRDDVLADS